jgi:pimeloyl-ACP methyl ester carboxylesterase
MNLPAAIRLQYVERGDRAGIPVVLLHGFSDSWRSFEGVLSHLPGHLRSIAVSQRGHGDSDRPPTGYRARDFASDVAGLLSALGLERAVVVGHSMGASVAQRFALDHPDRVLALVLVGARATWRDHPGVIELCDYARSMTDPVDPGFVQDFQRSTISRPVPDALVDVVVAESLKLPARVWQATCEEFLLVADTSRELPRLRVPTLLLCGEADGYARDAQESLAVTIAGSRLELYPDTGHALHWEAPARFVADLTAFVDGITSPARIPRERRRLA